MFRSALLEPGDIRAMFHTKTPHGSTSQDYSRNSGPGHPNMPSIPDAPPYAPDELSRTVSAVPMQMRGPQGSDLKWGRRSSLSIRPLEIRRTEW
jgi:hypothetical protein